MSAISAGNSYNSFLTNRITGCGFQTSIFGTAPLLPTTLGAAEYCIWGITAAGRENMKNRFFTSFNTTAVDQPNAAYFAFAVALKNMGFVVFRLLYDSTLPGNILQVLDFDSAGNPYMRSLGEFYLDNAANANNQQLVQVINFIVQHPNL